MTTVSRLLGRSSIARVAALLAILAAAAGMDHGRVAASDEVRGLWVQRTALASPESIAQMVSSARANGFNTLFVQVRSRGDAYFNDGVERRAAALAPQPDSFDPLAEALRLARVAGLRVHAWVVVNLVTSASDLPASRDHVIYRHPEWLMVPRPLAAELLHVDPRSPEYLGRLVRWSRARTATVEGLYLSPMHPGSLAYTTSVIEDLVARYPVDGVHLDYVRYPDADFDYGRLSLERFKQDIRPSLTPAERERVDRLEYIDPFAYPEAFPRQWRQVRQAQVTALVARIGSTVKRTRPAALVSAAIIPDPRAALEERLQDWRTWVDNGFIDALCPMAYTTEAKKFAAQIEEVRTLAAGRHVWAGIGAYRLSPRETIENIQTARRLGVNGVILFSYDNLVGPANGATYLAAIGRAFNGS